MNDPKAWARKLVAEYEAGNPPKPGNVYRIAYAALGLKFPEGAPPDPKQRNVRVCQGSGKVSAPANHPVPKHPPVQDAWWDSTDTE
ncbi:MAG: hypothetical protein LBV73_27355 [Paraburkholderia sp.]|nr:hypothetical protein [Paraburkholderia sp.]